MAVSRVIPIAVQGASPKASGSLEFRHALPLSLYIHVPWCVQKCPYCDFNSHALKDGLPEEDYLAALIADVEAALPLVWGRKISTIFFGGGTPSLFSAAAIGRILEGVQARIPFAPDIEITLEATAEGV